MVSLMDGEFVDGEFGWMVSFGWRVLDGEFDGW